MTLPAGVTLITPDRFRRMAWRNGFGSTLEIALAPEGATLGTDRFLWRASIAEVERDGPFSAFPGYDRTLLLLSGAGMILDFAGHGTARLDRPGMTLRFSGDWTATARLLGGPVRDFNIIVDRDRVEHQTEVIALGRMRRALSPAAATTTLLFALAGDVEVALGETSCPVPSGALLRIDTDKARLGAAAAAEAATLYRIDIAARGATDPVSAC